MQQPRLRIFVGFFPEFNKGLVITQKVPQELALSAGDEVPWTCTHWNSTESRGMALVLRTSENGEAELKKLN